MSYTTEMQTKARELLASGQVACVIGYEVGPRGRTRPAFVYHADDVARLVWNRACTHNLTVYLRHKLRPTGKQKEPEPVAVVVKPCDSRAIHVLLAEHQLQREQVHVIGVACGGIVEGAGFAAVGADSDSAPGQVTDLPLQDRCKRCAERTPVIYDTLIGEPPDRGLKPPVDDDLDALEAMTPVERAEFWLSQFDRCLRCYACRQACPMCACPTCLYERDDSLWVGLGIGLNEKRTFHLGRAYHLAGRCIGCNECERVCPVKIPIGLLNRKLAKAVETAFGYRAGVEPVPSPITTILDGGEG
jgi:formate dehydrogenase subunit beta